VPDEAVRRGSQDGRSIWKENQLSEKRTYRKFTAAQKAELSP
jgi:hypothetical protein